jgi:hypothetical protein
MENTMHSFHNARFASSNRQHEALTLDAVRQYAPSAFATQAHDSRSDRYTYIPTSTVIEATAQARKNVAYKGDAATKSFNSSYIDGDQEMANEEQDRADRKAEHEATDRWAKSLPIPADRY